jgi:replicative DNA helicase
MTIGTKTIEQNLISAFIENEDLFAKCEHLVSEKLFNNDVNKLAFRLVKKIRSSGVKPDPVLLAKALADNKVPQALIPTYILTEASYRYQPEQYVIILFEQNRIKNHLLKPLHSAYVDLESNSGSPLDIMQELKSKINDIDMVLNNVSKEENIKDIVKRTIEEIRELRDSDKKVGYPTGLLKLDDITGGLLPGVVVIGAPPSVGKTSLLVNIIKKNAIDNDVPIVFFSIEMPATQIVKNIFSNMFEINTMAVRDGGVDDDQFKKIEGSINKFKENFIIDDTPAPTWQYIDAKITSIRKKIPKTKQIIVMIDYIQLMDNTEDEKKGRTDEAIMSLRVKGLMNMWKRHNLCVIELSQLGREVVKEKRRPRMSDLKESGAIEANANVVMLLHRPDYYEENPTDDNGRSLKGIMEIIVDKNRGGRRGFVYANFIGKYSKLTDFNKEEWESGSGIV